MSNKPADTDVQKLKSGGTPVGDGPMGTGAPQPGATGEEQEIRSRQESSGVGGGELNHVSGADSKASDLNVNPPADKASRAA